MSRRRALAVVLALACSACTPSRLKLPDGPGSSLPDFFAIFDRATSSCRGVRTFTAEIGLSGRVADRKLRGRALIGLGQPSSLRLEGLAPFGAPLFILVAHDQMTTLVLPRENRVLTGEPPGAVLAALTGIDLEPIDLLSIMSGCISRASPLRGRLYGRWAAIDLEDKATVWLEQVSSAWHVRAGTRDALRVEYGEVGTSSANRVRLSIERDPARAVDLVLNLSQIEKNVPLGPDAFSVTVPDGSESIGLEELRGRGPLGGSTSSP